ncbi:MAG: hypothetical protein ACO3A8_02855 [Steroidobacteraceae bacterium]|jgi:hypothetical protein
MNPETLSAQAVLELARVTGVAVDDEAMAARIAAGAANAVAAVRDALVEVQAIGVELFDAHADHLATLERLAEPEA